MYSCDVDFNEQDMTDFRDLVTRYQTELGLSPQLAGKVALTNLFTSFRASTRKSPARRKVRAASRKRKNDAGYPGRRRFEVENYMGDRGIANFFIYERSVQEARLHPTTLIHYSGLAYTSWGWAQRDVFNTGKIPTVGYRRPSGSVSSSVMKAKGEYTVTVENRIGYIRKSFKTSGDQTISSAMYRANKSMLKTINERLSKVK